MLLKIAAVFGVVLVLLYAVYRLVVFGRWYIFLKDYQQVADRLDQDITLLREGKVEEALLRESVSNRIVEEFCRKYPAKHNK